MNNYTQFIDVSIIVVNYNNFSMLNNCLESIACYTTEIEYEIIIIDNNSTEGLIEEITDKFENISLIKNDKNKGFAAANNQGFKIAKGKYILLLNNDTILFENSIKKVFDFSESSDDPVFVGCQLLNEDRTYQDTVVQFPTIWNSFTENLFIYKLFPKWGFTNKYFQNYLSKDNSFEVDIVKGAFLFSKRTDMLALNGFDERFFFYSEETDLCYRFKKEFNGKVYFYPQTSIIHFGGEKTIKNSWQAFKYLSIGKIKYFQKHFAGLRYFLAIIVHYLGFLARVFLYFIQGVFTINKDLILKSGYYLKLLTIYPKNKFK